MTTEPDTDLRQQVLGWLPTDPCASVIGGKRAEAGAQFGVVDPSTGTEVAQWLAATRSEVDHALHTARTAHDSGVWARMPLGERAEVLERAAAAIRSDALRLAALEALDTGKAVSGALTYDLPEAATAFAHAAGRARDLHGEVRRTAFPPDLLPGGGPRMLTMALREPVGVVVELLPWNGPLMTGSQRLSAALAAGCSIIVKAPEQAVITVLELARILTEAGLPDGVLSVLLGPGETVGEQLVTDPRVDLVSLTGGIDTGRRVAELCAQRLTPVHLELGGKAPVIVMPDADLDQAVPWSVMAAFVNMGEVCVAGSRLLVHASVYADVVAGVAAMASGMPVGDALDRSSFFGPLVDDAHAARVRGFVSRAVDAGDASVVTGGGTPDGLRDSYVSATVLGQVRPGSEVAQQEVFGPVLAAMSFETETEAVALANGVAHGLNATVFTRDIETAFRVSDALDVGEVNINCHFAPDMNGGRGEPRKSSGLARPGVDGYTTTKSVTVSLGA